LIARNAKKSANIKVRRDEMTEEMKKLQKEINGKRVVWTNEESWPGLKINAILLWEPKGDRVSVKQYGYTPEQMYDLLNDDDECYTLEQLRRPDDCLSTIAIEHIEALRKLAKMKEGDEYNFTYITGRTFAFGDPACPYG
jgi:hypothetical protein